MIFMEFTPSVLTELKLMLVLCVIIFGWELSAYFFYQYYKLRDQEVQLNRILLAFGVLFASGFFCLLCIMIVNIFTPEEMIAEILRKMGFWVILSGAFLFWAILYVEQFSKLINRKIHLFLILKSLVPIIALIFLDSQSTLFLPCLGVVFFDGIFLLFLQVKVIKYSVAEVKKRFKLIFLAEAVIMVAMLLGSDRFKVAFNLTAMMAEGFYFLGIFVMFISEVIVLFAIIEFPSILEFKWKESLIKLVIVNKRNNSCLYRHDFYEIEAKLEKNDDKELQRDEADKLFSGGIIGIDSITAAVTKSEGAKMRKIQHGNSLIMLDYSTLPENQDIVFALVVNEDLHSLEFFLKVLRDQFQSFYKDLLTKIDQVQGNESIYFGSFDIILKNILFMVK